MDLMGLIEAFFSKVGDLTWGWSLVPMLIVFGLLFSIGGGNIAGVAVATR